MPPDEDTGRLGALTPSGGVIRPRPTLPASGRFPSYPITVVRAARPVRTAPCPLPVSAAGTVPAYLLATENRGPMMRSRAKSPGPARKSSVKTAR